jgi:hypothetical protein
MTTFASPDYEIELSGGVFSPSCKRSTWPMAVGGNAAFGENHVQNEEMAMGQFLKP